MAQKVGVAVLYVCEMAPVWLVMIDPPPAGPCTRGFVQPGLILASQIVRLGREIAGLDTDATVLKQLMGRSDKDWARATNLATGNAATDAVNTDEDWTLAIVATEQLAAMGEVPFTGAAIERTKRRMDVYRKCMELWHRQDETPVPYDGSILLVTSTGRWDWFGQVYDAHCVERLEAYGVADSTIALEGAHTAIVQDICTDRLPEVTTAVRELLYGEAVASAAYVSKQKD